MHFMKDEMKKKDEEKLEEMQREIDEATRGGPVAQEEEDEARDDVKPSESPEDAQAQESGEAGGAAGPSAEELQKQIDLLEARLKDKEDKVLRLQADFDNFRRRTRQEKDELSSVVTQAILTDMLPLLDNFERAMQAEAKDSENFQSGVEMIFKQLKEILTKNGLEPIPTEGAKFDPNFHQAVMRVQDAEKEDDDIAAELQKGYMAKGKVIRPSMVQVVAN